MKPATGKEFAKMLERKGWILQRVHGSHHIFTKAGNPLRISVPIHGNSPLKIGLWKHLVKLADIDEGEWHS